jgi:hypothetical protein
MEYWIKSIGASRSPLEDEWLRPQENQQGQLTAPRLAERVHFPKNARPRGIAVGDAFLLYGVTDIGGRLIAAGRFDSPFYEDDGSKEPGERSPEDLAAWPWRIEVTILLSLWHAHRGPTLDTIDLPGTKIRRRSHIRLPGGRDQYLAGIDALAGVARL